MADTDTLIAQLSAAPQAKKLAPPQYYILLVLAVLVLYALGVGTMNHVRPDLMLQLHRPTFAVELALLAGITLSSICAAIAAMYPDAYQRRHWLKLPYVLLAVLLLFLGIQLLMPMNPDMVIRPLTFAGHACTMYIGAITMLPSALIFLLLRKGATVRPLQAGSFAVLASAGIGCLTLRIAEQNDSLAHLVTYHYVPTLLFAALGALLGKWLIRW